MDIRPFLESDTAAVISLWEDCGLVRPWNDPRKDIERKLTCQRELFLVAEQDGAIIGSIMGGYDGHRGSVYYLAVSPGQQGRGYGSSLMGAVEDRLLQLGCPKINLFVRKGNRAAEDFYGRRGYAEESSASWGRRLIPDV